MELTETQKQAVSAWAGEGMSLSDIQKNLLGMTTGDIGRLFREVTFGLLSGVVLTPIVGLVLMIFPLFALFITSPIRKEERGIWTVLGIVISIGLALVAYWIGKYTVLPGMRETVPFAAWIPAMPTWLNSILLWGTPMLIGLLGLGIAWNFTFRRHNASVMNFMLIYMVADSTLTLAVYGFLFYNSF